MMNMMQNKEVVENIGTALNAIKRLRTSVGHVFSTLGNGAETESSVEDRETKLMLELQEQLNLVNGNLKDTETTINNLIVPGGAFTLSNTSILSHETHPEKQALYPQLLHSYKWNDKLATYSINASNVIGQNTLRRSFFNNNKRRRPLSGNLNVTSQQFHQFVNSMNTQNMIVRVHRSFASSAIIHVNLGRVLKAAIIVKGYIIEWVCIKGFEESLDNVDDHWSESRHAVFRKVQDHTHSAMIHFYSPNIPELSLRSYLMWLRSYINLFVDPCKKCKRYLHNALPPTWRDLRNLDTLHEECKH
ncbi:mediator of RNA polymerase II transcription subunit 27 [Culicoides brevitarsis]|uniref:mediator of RNA polymerase II transcription subunit 27 n=1 Tax=Culicoides brevitarsis TaxID=469753 RepID=UPI00307B6D17